EIAVLPYDSAHDKFSGAGGSGSVALDKTGRIFGLNITYITPHWWLEQQIKASSSIPLFTMLSGR
ncbi:hypothetical protein SCHPADRAFT_796276, partial [Schizopora paradoxa]